MTKGWWSGRWKSGVSVWGEEEVGEGGGREREECWETGGVDLGTRDSSENMRDKDEESVCLWEIVGGRAISWDLGNCAGRMRVVKEHDTWVDQ